MRVWPLLAALVGVVAVAALIGMSKSASAERGCDAGTQDGYSYAGHQASYRGHGVRATITLTQAPSVEAGHVAGWVGVGGPHQGVNGADQWIQAGIASMPQTDPILYVEIERGGPTPEFVVLEQGVAVGRSHKVAVLEMAGRPAWWRVWVDGHPATDPIRLRGSSGRWAPIATAESWNGGEPTCNEFDFEFERVSVSYGGGGSWRPFVPAYDFLDGTHTLRNLASAPAAAGVYRRPEASGTDVLPYAFVASS